MNQSTSFAQVATNLLNVLQGYTKGIRFVTVLTMLLTLGIGQAWGAETTVTWTASSGALGNGVGTGNIKTGSYSWNYTRTLISGTSYTGWLSNCVQIGKKEGVENITFSTSNIPGTIKKVSIECASYQGKHNVAITVGGKSYLSSTATSSWTTVSAKSGSGTSSGTIQISLTGGTRALYIKSISVTYEEAAATVPVTGVSLNPSSLTLTEGDSETLTATVAPANATNKTVTWSTSDANIATVSNGKVTAIAEGSATITVKTTDGNKTATCKVTVNPKPKYTVTWNVNGEVFETTQVTEGSKPTFPATPSSCDNESNTFYGWATATWDGKIDNISEKTIYTSANNMPAVNGAVTYYAVFATKETSGSGTAGWNTVTSPADLEVGATYAISNEATNGTYLSTWDGGNNFDGSTSTICPLILGGSEGAWTFQIADGSTYNNYYLTATSQSNNRLRAVSILDEQCQFSISFDNNISNITCTTKTTHNILRYNPNGGSPIFACYSSGQSDVYLQKYSTGSTTTYSDYITTCTKETSVTFDLNGGSGTFETETLDGDSYTIPGTEPTRNGYNFAGWQINGEGNLYQPGATIDGITDPITLVAKWSAVEYTITYHLNGGSGVENTTYTIESADITLPMPTPEQQGLTFVGWYANADFTGNAVTVIARGSTGNKEFWAKWEKSTPTFAWSATTCTAALEADNTFPTLDNPNSLSPVTYTSSNTGVATIDANGNITLIAAGTTTITAAGAETDTHKSATAIYELNVLESNCRWVETEIEDIDSGDEVVITMTTASGVTYALPSEKFTSGAPNATSVKVDRNSLELIIPQIVWIIYKNGDNLTFESNYNQGNYLAFTNSDAGVRVNDNTNRNFVVDDVSGYLMNTQTDDARYLGVHNTKYTWYSYKTYSVNTSAQTLKFYKKVCLDSETFWVDYNLANVTCTNTPPHSQIAKSETLALNFEAATGYALPDNVTVTGATPSWNKATGTLTISNPTDNVTITIEAIKLHTITWMVGGSELTTGSQTTSVENGKKITAIPANPNDNTLEDCGATKFMGWSTDNIGSTPDADAPTDLFTTVAEAQSKIGGITENKTFYAVFATAEETDGGTVDATLSFASTAQRTSLTNDKAVWQQNNITLTNTKGTEQNAANCTTYVNPVRFYKYSKIKVEHTSDEISKILFTCNISAYATVLNTSIGTSNNVTVEVNDKEVVVTFNSPVEAFEVKLTDQVRMDALTITAGGGTITTYSNYVTNCCATPVPTNGSYTSPSETSVALTWDGESTRYHITGNGLDDYTDDESYTVTGLTECNEYTFYVSAYPEDGCESEAIAITAQPFSGAKTVTFNYNGNGQANTTSSTSCGNTSITLPTPVWTGYRFMGWFNAASGGTKVGEAGASYKPTDDITLHAHWEKEYTVTYDANGGSTTCANGNYIEGETVTICTTNPSKTGYTFAGWTYSPSVTITDGRFVMPASDVTITAQWQVNSYTVTWNPNGGNWGGSTSNIVETYEYGAAIKEPADPKRENGIFKGWNPSVPSNMPAGNQTYTAQWEMVYTLTFVDMNAGGTTSTLTQTSSGQNIVAPTANSEVCDMWTFIGWAPSNSLNGGTDKPTGFIAAGETIPGSQITGNKTYYSVYSYNSDNTQEFEVGKSGTYFMYAISGTTKYYATTVKTSNTAFYANTESDMSTYSSKKSTFILTYNTNTTKYVIKHINTTADKESEGYFYQADPNKKDITVNSSSSSSFEIAKGETQGSYRIKFTYTANSNTVTGNFGQSSSSFQGYAEGYDIFFEPASEIQYYNAANCGEVETYTMSFHNPFGDEDALIWYDAEHEESYYTNKPLNTSIDVFPTMVYNGWIFIGWTANQQYNDLIGEENLDDENSATNDPADLVSTIYSNEAGWAYTLNSNVTMYPVFTKFEDNEPFDMVNGGDYYIYYIADADITASVDKYGAVNRIYAGAWESGGTSDSYGATQSCTNATLFTFTKLSNGKWTIYDNTNRKYLCAGATDNNLALNATAATNGEWTITVHNGNQVNAVSKDGYTLSALSQNAVSGTFKNYATSNINNNSGYYHRVYLGSCTERVYSSNPSNKPIITLSGTPQVTSTQDQSIRAQGELSISATKLAANATITLTADNEDVYFATDKTANFSKATKPVTPLTLKADEKGKLAMTTVYVHYKPTSTSTLGVQTANITATTGTDGQPDYATATTIAALRNLPANFVIATKVGATWYALPANMNGATNPEGVVIDVDETTMTATAPNTTVYTLFPVKTTSTQYDRFADFGDRVRFSAVNNESKGLWATSNGNTINNGAQIASESDGGTTDNTNPSYEWKITTTIVNGNWQYTLQTDQTNNQKYLRYYNSKWGTYANGENDLYFLPVTEVEPFEMQVVEWYPTKVLVQTEATLATVSATIGGEEVAEPVVTQKGGKLYEISNLPLETNPTKLLAISYTADEITYANNTVIPIIISRAEKNIADEPFATLTADVYNSADLVVRDGAVLTVNGTEKANTFANVTIYPTAKISVPAMNKNGANNKLSVNSLTFFGGIDEIYDGSTYTINKYGVPELSLKGLLNKTTTQMDYIMRVDLDQMYSLTVPYDVQLADIKYWDGSDIALGSALYVSAYDGEARANQSKKTWIYETDFESRLGAATLKAGVGYTISAELQSGVGSEYSILRMPMMSNVASGATEAAKTVAVTAWGKDANVTDNHKGWNLVGNPYMTTIQGADDAGLVLGYLKETGSGPWEWVEKTYRYVTIPSDDGTYYWQQKFTDAVLPPFKNFFVQVGTTGELVFDLGTRQSMPARSTQAAIEKEVEFEILMSNDARQDNTGLLISEEYSPAYEINADLEKMIGSMSVYTIYGGYKLAYNALSPINASEWIPMGYIAPAAGEYTFRLDDVENIAEQVEHVYIIDYNANNIVDLMDEEYKFTTDKEQNDNRFAINVVLSQDKDNTTTGLDMIQGNNAAPIKFIHQDKMYIYNEGIIYDATGKQITNINK